MNSILQNKLSIKYLYVFERSRQCIGSEKSKYFAAHVNFALLHVCPLKCFGEAIPGEGGAREIPVINARVIFPCSRTKHLLSHLRLREMSQHTEGA
jgi:hypothetical protein